MTKSLTADAPPRVAAKQSKSSSSTEIGVFSWPQSWSDFGDFQRQNIDAVLSSATLAGESAATFNSKVAEFTRASAFKGADVLKQFAAAKSLQELVELQALAARDGCDAAAQQATALFGLFTEGLTKAVKPISDRIAFTGGTSGR